MIGTPRTKEPDPELGHGAVDKRRYLSRDVAASELDQVFRRTWLYAVPASDVRAPGSWAVFDLGPESILIVRTEDGALAAHHNVCQHRGRRLMDDERGRAAAFRCGYHAWTYRLDGELRTVHEPQLFPADLDRCALDLKPVRVEEWGGLVWLCLDPDAEPLLAYLSPLPEHVDRYHLDSLAIVADQSVEWDCNWKVAVDTFRRATRAGWSSISSLRAGPGRDGGADPAGHRARRRNGVRPRTRLRAPRRRQRAPEAAGPAVERLRRCPARGTGAADPAPALGVRAHDGLGRRARRGSRCNRRRSAVRGASACSSSPT